MMKRVMKLSIVMICLSMFVGILSACGNGNNDSSNKATNSPAVSNSDNPYEKHLEISVAIWDIESYLADAKNDPIYQSIMDKFNITIKPVNTTWDDYTQKIQMWAASDQLPDVFAIDAIGTQYQRKWIEQDVVAALPDDLSAYPNLETYFEVPDIAGLSVDGVRYTIPRRTFPSIDWTGLERVVAYRWDLAQQAGITKEPETWEEFTAMIDAIVKADPENKNITGITASTVKMIGGLFWTYGNAIATSDGSGVDFKWIKEDGQFIPAVFSKKALPAVENMKKMYDDGLIDPDIALTSTETAYDKFGSGKAAAIISGNGFISVNGNLYEKRWSKTNPDQDFTESVKVLKPLVGPDGETTHGVFKTYWSESYFNSNISDEKMQRLLALYDYVLSDEGKTLLTYGIEGVDYKVEGDRKVALHDTPIFEKYYASVILKDLVAYENYQSYDLDSPTISNVAIREAAVEYVDNLLNNSTVPEYDIRLTYMSTPTKDSFTVFDHDDLIKVLHSNKPAAETWNEIIEGYKAKGLDKMIQEVNEEAKLQGIE